MGSMEGGTDFYPHFFTEQYLILMDTDNNDGITIIDVTDPKNPS